MHFNKSIFILYCLSSTLFAQYTRAQSKPAVHTVAKAAKTDPAPKAAAAYVAIDETALRIPDSSTKTTDGIAAYINARFTQPGEKTRAAFIWTATNIQYDIANMYAIDFYEKAEEKVSKALKTRKGICENYAALFHELCTKTGIRSYIIEGYTKQNGFTDYIPHAWCAAFVDDSWFLFDPTWGSGYVNNGKFYNKINNNYFRMIPPVAIRSHMPFDPLWEFLYYPISNQQFYEGQTQEDKTSPYFNFVDSIAAYERLSEVDAYAAAADRIKKNGVKNSMIFNQLEYLRREIEVEKQNKIVYLYNSALTDHNRSLNEFNAYIDYYNKQFKPAKTDPEIQAMLDASAAHLKEASAKLDQIKSPDQNTSVLIGTFRSHLADLSARIEEQREWLKKYFSKGKMGRRSMFTKYTWFGVPLN
jgi:Transglutaminase-like superfamily